MEQKLQLAGATNSPVHSIIDEFGKGAPDEEWIPGIASEHGCVITQDLNINRSRFGCDILVANSRDHKGAETLWIRDRCERKVSVGEHL
jgi:hypothetical protein